MNARGAAEPESPVSSAVGPRMAVSLAGQIVIEVDDEALTLLGRTGEDLVGRPLPDLWSQAEQSAIAARFDEALLLGRDQIAALAAQRADGSPVWLSVDARFDYRLGERLELRLTEIERESSAATQTSPSLADDAAAGVFATADEPTSALTVGGDEAALDDTAALVLAALEATGAAVLFVDGGGRVRGATPAVERLIGRSVAEVRGLDLPALLPVGQAAERALTAAREAGVRQSVLAEVADRGGQVLVEWVPGLGPGSGYVALSTPAPPANGETERIRLQARLISHVAHDLRGALAAVYAGLRTLVDDLQDGTEQRETAAKSLVEVQRASRIVEEVLALSRPGRLRRADLPLAQVVIQAVDRRRPEAAERAVDVRTSLDPEVVVSGDRSSLEAAVGNLLENALRAMPDGGTLAVSLQMEDRAAAGVLLTVADTGVGIPPDLQPTVFEAFVSDSPGGSGLGLTIARHVVLAHGGQIDFDSEIGVGTTFRVWLPRAT